MSFFGLLKEIISPVTQLVDTVTTTDEERLKLKNALEKIQSDVTLKVLEIESKEIEARSKALDLQNQLLMVDAKSDHVLQWSWRPVGAYWSYVIISLHLFGIVEIPEKGWWVIGTLLGVTTLTRGIEKHAKAKKK